jgi:hypothetical protein
MTRQARKKLGLLTTAEVAARLKVGPRRVLALAKARGVEPLMRVGRSNLWSVAQVAELRPKAHGRPPAKKSTTKKKPAKAGTKKRKRSA